MADQRVNKLAKILIGYSLEIQKGDKLIIEGAVATLPLIRELYREGIKAGAHVEYVFGDPIISEIKYKNATDEQLEYISDFEKLYYEGFNKYISVWGDESTKPLASVDPKRIAVAKKVRKDNFVKFLNRMSNKECMWVGTQYPTYSSAQDADMTFEDYEDFVYGAGMLDLEDPVAYWKEVSAKQEKICTYLDTITDLKIVSEGTDISMKVGGRKWINCDAKENFPDGEVFTSPIEDSINGMITFTFPAIYQGKEVENVTLYFEDGKIVRHSASKNEEFLGTVLDTDTGSRMVGEIAIGTNYGIKQFTKNMLFDEKIGGTVHMAVGASLPEAGGVNESSIHWDMICDMRSSGQIFADGKLIYEKGEFVIEF